ncbi:Predicted metal-dependent hydrolase [Coprococcus sp. ART55/1]|uniref:M48 family metallopeptidase n=1 Tax=Coprococcus sp. ART55/1 TaxID=751585 RepID=UPI0001CCE2C8|nr:SprT family zinc-dependent metalloprotease [Coprococcus sp. ART55/1]CBK83514.1 Predicted metal-dependent hydrolase [Coprococcus sp. ART55/1]
MNNSDKFEYSVVRSRRKSICIEIDRDLNIKVRAPLRMTDSQIQSFVDSRQNWIRSHLEIMQKRISNMSDEKNPSTALTDADIKALSEQARIYIPSRVEHFAQIIGVTYGRITIRHQKTRWGSCSSSGNLNFNCALMNTTPKIIDYVVVHELCHRKQMNHSALFWAEVEKALPNYKELRSALKNYRC